VWPVFVAMIPIFVLEALQMCYHDGLFKNMTIVYGLLLYVLLFGYMVFAIKRYERWLSDNYADLEDKKVWLSQVVLLFFVLLFVLYVLVDSNLHFIYYLLHIVELVLFILLLWRVESLPTLKNSNSPLLESLESEAVDEAADESLSNIESLLQRHCVDRQLYLQHDLNLQQLAQTIGTNRTYLSQYFSRKGISYNIYINDLRINHFISRYKESAADRQPIAYQQLARECGYSSYSTFSLAFKQRTGQSVSAWIRSTDSKKPISGV
jgi:AraC-like DNA-binding protein